MLRLLEVAALDTRKVSHDHRWEIQTVTRAHASGIRQLIVDVKSGPNNGRRCENNSSAKREFLQGGTILNHNHICRDLKYLTSAEHGQ